MTERLVKLEGLPAFKIYLHDKFDRYVTADILRDGIWEPQHTALVMRNLGLGDTFLDIGANVGWYTLVAGLAVGAEGAVFAVEPDPTNAALIRRSVSEAGLTSVTIIEAGASDEAGSANLYLCDENLGDHRLAPQARRETVAVDIVRLDDVIPRHLKVKMIKIDVQGWEPKVISGAMELISRDKPNILVEFWPLGLADAGFNWEETFLNLEKLGYATFDVDWNDGSLRPMSVEDMIVYAQGATGSAANRFIDLFLTAEPTTALRST